MILSYQNYSSNRVTGFNQLPISLTLEDMFIQSALHSATYPSDNVDGKDSSRDSWNNNIEYCGGALFERYISDEHLDEIGSDLIPQAIKYTAALYRLFWREFHPDIEGPEYVEILVNPVYAVSGKYDREEITSCEWDFDFEEGNFTTDKEGLRVPTYQFNSSGPRTIAIRVNGGPEIVARKQIYVKPYPIHVDYPEGFNSLIRALVVSPNHC